MEFLAKMLIIAISSIFINNYVLARFLGLCPFLGVSKKMDSAFGMGAAVAFVMTMASALSWTIYKYMLEPFGLDYLRTIAFVLAVASLVQFIEMVIQKSAPTLYRSLGVFLPLITTNCAVLGVALLNIDDKLSFIDSVLNGFFGGIGFMFVLLLMAGLRERLDKADVPETMRGIPLALIIAGCMSLAFLGFSGLNLG
jgi:electron transport complex protein RnfA